MGRSAAERQRDCRARRACGLGTFHLTLDEVAVAEMLIAGGLLAPQDADDHRKLFSLTPLQKNGLGRRASYRAARLLLCPLCGRYWGQSGHHVFGAHVRF